MYIFTIIIHLLYIINILKNIENIILNLNKILYKENLYNVKYNINKNNNIYYKYNNNYTIRSYIDFKNKKLILETINNKNIKNKLKNEIIDISINLSKYIYELKKNNLNYNIKFTNNIIKYFIFLTKIKKNINKFSYLIIKEKLKKNNIKNNKNIYYIKLNIVNNYSKKNDIINYIKKISNIYNIDFLLILSILKIESNFNQFIISKSNAIGLMQIIQNKSGIDVFKILGKKNYPNIEYLLNFKKNIKIGTIYIYILQNNYLYNIVNENSLRYLTIVSYNVGINSIFKIFSDNYYDSINTINSMNYMDIYNFITTYSCYLENIKYLKKVNNFYIKFKPN